MLMFFVRVLVDKTFSTQIMADDLNDLNKRLQALQNKGNTKPISNESLNSRLSDLQAYQRKDVDPNATDDDLWSRLNQLDAENANNGLKPYSAASQPKHKSKSHLGEYQTDALLNRIGNELNLQSATNTQGISAEKCN